MKQCITCLYYILVTTPTGLGQQGHCNLAGKQPKLVEPLTDFCESWIEKEEVRISKKDW